MILFAKPIDVIVKLNLFEKTVSPPPKVILYLSCSWASDLLIFTIFNFEKYFLFPDAEIK